MRSLLKHSAVAVVALAAVAAAFLMPTEGQAQENKAPAPTKAAPAKAAPAKAAAYKAPRAKDGKPNLNGIWQSINTANWNLEAHGASMPVEPKLGAMFAVQPGQSVVVEGTIPYLPGGVEKRDANFKNRINREGGDGENKCFMTGVPRANYMPYPFQIIQGTTGIMIVYEYAGAVRVINMGAPTKAPADSWMGWSNGRWDGESLVIDVTSLNEDAWFDRAGNHHSNQLHVVERYTPRSADTMIYEARIEDPKTFSRPWTIRFPLYRRVEENARIMEDKCVVFAEELLYGHLRKPADAPAPPPAPAQGKQGKGKGKQVK